jgi:hypothetical protein
MYDADKYRCPFCRQALFVYKSQGYRSCLRYVIITNNVVRIVFGSIALVLQLYKGHYWTAAINNLINAFSVSLEWYTWSYLTGNWDLTNTRVKWLWLILGMTAYNAWWQAVAVRTWDQVTL